MQQITMSRVNLDKIKTCLESPARRKTKAFDNGLNSRQIEFGRHSIVRRKRDRARREWLPAAFRRAHQDRSSLEWRSRAGFAPGVRQLHSGARALTVNKLRNAAEVGDVLVLPDAKISRRDAALRQNCRGLKHDQPGSSLRAAAQVDKVPVIGKAVHAGVLAHGRNANAIAKFNRAKLEWRKKRSRHI